MFNGFTTPDFPKRLTVELSAACNLSCVMCPRQYVPGADGFMRRDLFEKIIEEVAGREVEAVVPFFRGEALLHPSFLEMMRLLREKTRARIQLATNALLLSRAVSKELLGLPVDFISFSLDASTEETYKQVRPGGDFHRVMANIEDFLRLRGEMPASSTTVQVSLTEGDHNRHEIPSFIEGWQLKADRVRIYPRHSEKGRFGRLGPCSFLRPEATRTACLKPFADMVIYADGQVALCNHDWNRKGKGAIGSVTERTIREIWEGPAYERIRGLHLRRMWNEVDPCGHCDHWQGNGSEAQVGILIDARDALDSKTQAIFAS
jgi:radical SAM protein with 4Fe4S-binding SPASM domain